MTPYDFLRTALTACVGALLITAAICGCVLMVVIVDKVMKIVGNTSNDPKDYGAGR